MDLGSEVCQRQGQGGNISGRQDRLGCNIAAISHSVQSKLHFLGIRSCRQVAGESTTQAPVSYQDVIQTMDVAIKVGFIDVGLTDPAGLAARPQM